MKKDVKIILISALLVLAVLAAFAVSNINSANITGSDIININPENPQIAGMSPDELPQTQEELEAASTAYFKQEWTKILSNNKVGQVLLKISSVLTYLNFFWKPVLGLEYSLSWAFIFAVALWFVLFYFVYSPMSAILNSKLFGFIGGFIVACLVGISGVIKKAVDLLSFVINNKWIAIICLAIAILIMFLIIKLSGGLKEYIEQQKEAAEKQKTKEAGKKVQVAGKVAEKELESYD